MRSLGLGIIKPAAIAGCGLLISKRGQKVCSYHLSIWVMPILVHRLDFSCELHVGTHVVHTGQHYLPLEAFADYVDNNLTADAIEPMHRMFRMDRNPSR